MRMTSICSPLMPPWALTWSMTSCEPMIVSFTLAATGPDRSADWPITIWAEAPVAASASSNAAARRRGILFFFFIDKTFPVGIRVHVSKCNYV